MSRQHEHDVRHCFLLNLPSELQENIFEDLDILDRVYLKSTCKHYHNSIDLSKFLFKKDLQYIRSAKHKLYTDSISELIEYVYREISDIVLPVRRFYVPLVSHSKFTLTFVTSETNCSFYLCDSDFAYAASWKINGGVLPSSTQPYEKKIYLTQHDDWKERGGGGASGTGSLLLLYVAVKILQQYHNIHDPLTTSNFQTNMNLDKLPKWFKKSLFSSRYSTIPVFSEFFDSLS